MREAPQRRRGACRAIDGAFGTGSAIDGALGTGSAIAEHDAASQLLQNRIDHYLI